ncbi:MAG: sulfatase [Bryobacterales bacterium]|nr:sulfatase [Bryobacterales bacterium]MDE0621866.1 sulfatase [Bryobacterales bacterium]
MQRARRRAPNRWPAIAALFGCALLPAGVASAVAPAASPALLNVVLVLVDDLGWRDLGCQGSDLYETPRIDALAAEAVRFTQAYSNCPVCSPSRAALLTGQYPGRVGFTGHITAIGRHRHPSDSAILPPADFMYLRDEFVTIAEALGTAGYASASIGKWHLGAESNWPLSHGFDLNVAGHTHGSPASYFFPYRRPGQAWNPDMPNLDLSASSEGEYLTSRLTDEALQFVERNRDRPFFLYLSHYAVHTPLQAPDHLVRKYRGKIAESASGANPVYAAMVESVDTSVGRILDRLEAAGVADRTVFILASDNGGLASVTANAPLRAGKGHLYEGGIRVPLIVRWPGHGNPGSVVRTPVTNADLFPFIAEVAGLAPSSFDHLDGRSLSPLIDGGPWTPRELVWYYPHYSPQAQAPGAAILSGGNKLIEFYDPPRVELYRLEDDLGESEDLALQEAALAESLRAKLNAWIEANVPLRHRPNPTRKRR